MRTLAALAVTAVLATLTGMAPTGAAEAPAGQPWRDPNQPAAQRARQLLTVLSQDEKIAVALDDLAPLARYGVPLLNSHDGPSGIGLSGTTAFPSSQALAATFDPGHAQAVGTAIADELRGKGRNVWLGPAADITRTPLAGRQPESLGEDPYLAGQLATAEAAAAKSHNVLVTAKHYAGNNQEYYRTGLETATGRTGGVDVEVSERALREIYGKPFDQLVTEGGADAVMCSYNRVGGTQACENKHLLDRLKPQFDGVVTPDYGLAVRDQAAAANAGVDIPQYDQGSGGRTVGIFTSGAVPQSRLDDIVRRTLFAIFDSGVFDHPVGSAQDVVSTAAHGRLAADVAADSMVLLRNEDHTLPLSAKPGASIAVIGPSGEDALYTGGGSAAVPTTVGANVTPLHGITARAGTSVTVTTAQGSAGDTAARTSLPSEALRPADGGGHGVTATYWNDTDFRGTPAATRTENGPGLTTPPASLASAYSVRWTGTLTPPETGLYRFTMLGRGITSVYVDGKKIGTGYREGASFLAGPQYPVQGTIRLAAGRPVDLRVDYSASLGRPSLTVGWQTPAQSQIPAAVAAAGKADVAVVFAQAASGEGMDHSTLALPGDQDQLIEAVAKANPRTVVVLNTGGPVLMPWLRDVDSVVQAWYPGQEFGTALARILFGDTNPSGRLPVTFPASDTQGPAAANAPLTYPGVMTPTGPAQSYAEGIYVGYRWYQKTGQKPLFPFGYGLSYGTFTTRAQVASQTAGDTIGQVRVQVRNTGGQPGRTTVQVYVGHLPTAVDTPSRQLAGFRGLEVKPGQEGHATIAVDRRSVSYFDEGRDAWVTPRGRTPVYVGTSAADARLAGWLNVR
ncbi:glycoside hydrolase family 3 C-terminal domain-containing protein [Streptomyces sp. NBC_00080]|uniref:glycoside hydrolase family 3 C-terminal domain-containing protein n=1 Tax=Streptomyces sp. NBC_00080 TaxID=2975645 RepID=UPI00324EBB7C